MEMDNRHLDKQSVLFDIPDTSVIMSEPGEGACSATAESARSVPKGAVYSSDEVSPRLQAKRSFVGASTAEQASLKRLFYPPKTWQSYASNPPYECSPNECPPNEFDRVLKTHSQEQSSGGQPIELQREPPKTLLRPQNVELSFLLLFETLSAIEYCSLTYHYLVS